MFRATLETLSEKKWKNENINWFIGILGIITHYDSLLLIIYESYICMTYVSDIKGCSPLQYQQPTGKEGSSPLGIRYHFCDIWIEGNILYNS